MSLRRLIVTCAVLSLPAATLTGCDRWNHSVAPDQNAENAVERMTAVDELDLERDAGEAAALGAIPITGPMTIDAPGNYRLAADLDVSQGDGIVVTASDVRLWLGDHRLRGPGNKEGRAVVVEGGRNVVVSGGRIERFGFGVVLTNASKCRIHGVRILGGDETANPPAGNPPQIGVMVVNGAENRITRNHLRDVNLGLFIRGPGSYGNRIDGNAVVAGANGLLAICYNPAPGADPAGPAGDLVRLNLLSRFATGIVASPGSARNVFTLNTIRYFVAPYEDANGTNVFIRNRTEQVAP